MKFRFNMLITLIATILITLTIIVCSAFLLVQSTGKLPPLADDSGNIIPNSLTEKGKVKISGIEQGFFIRSENPESPVILYLHGGVPELPFLFPRESNERLEKYFTVCYWDQRYIGMSYHKSVVSAPITIEQIVEDVYEMTKYLQERFNKKKIYILAHSWGTYIGIKTIEKYPENYYAYIGISQITNQLESEQLTYDYLMQHSNTIGDDKSVKKLKQFDKYAKDFPSLRYLSSIRSELLEKYGVGTIRENSSMSLLVKDVFKFQGYTIAEKINFGRGSKFHTKHLFPYLLADNLFESSISVETPVYFLHGKYDYTVSYSLAEKYFKLINAPHKEFISFENSAHSPNIDESEKFIYTMKKIIPSVY